LILEAANLTPDNIILETIWGDMLYFKGNYEKALEHFEFVHNRTPEDIQVISKIGLTTFQLMDYDKAIEYLTRFAERAARSYAHQEAVRALEQA